MASLRYVRVQAYSWLIGTEVICKMGTLKALGRNKMCGQMKMILTGSNATWVDLLFLCLLFASQYSSLYCSIFNLRCLEWRKVSDAAHI